MSAISNPGTTTTFGRNSSYPTCETLSFHSHNRSGVYNGRRCSSTTILPSANEHSLKENPANYRTLDRQTHLKFTENLSWLERCKQRLANLFKQISKSSAVKQGKHARKIVKFFFLIHPSEKSHSICCLYNLIVYTCV